MTVGTPSAFAQGTGGAVRVARLAAGTLTSWRVVISPTTGMPTLFGEGRFCRLYAGALGAQASVELVPAPVPARIGRPKPKKPAPMTLTGKIAELTARSIVIAEGTLETRT